MTDLFEEWITTCLDGSTFEEWLDHKTGSGRAQPVPKPGTIVELPAGQRLPTFHPKPVFGEAPDERKWIHNYATDEWTSPNGEVIAGVSLTNDQRRAILIEQKSERVFTPPESLFSKMGHWGY